MWPAFREAAGSSSGPVNTEVNVEKSSLQTGKVQGYHTLSSLTILLLPGIFIIGFRDRVYEVTCSIL